MTDDWKDLPVMWLSGSQPRGVQHFVLSVAHYAEGRYVLKTACGKSWPCSSLSGEMLDGVRWASVNNHRVNRIRMCVRCRKILRGRKAAYDARLDQIRAEIAQEEKAQ